MTRNRADVHTQYRHLVTELVTPELAHLHVHHLGGDELLASLQNSWPTATSSNACARTLR